MLADQRADLVLRLEPTQLIAFERALSVVLVSAILWTESRKAANRCDGVLATLTTNLHQPSAAIGWLRESLQRLGFEQGSPVEQRGH